MTRLVSLFESTKNYTAMNEIITTIGIIAALINTLCGVTNWFARIGTAMFLGYCWTLIYFS